MFKFIQQRNKIFVEASDNDLHWLEGFSIIKTRSFRKGVLKPISEEEKFWNGKNPMPLGVSYMLMERLKEANFDFKFMPDSQIQTKALDYTLGDLTARDYQAKATAKILSNYMGLIFMAVNAGKTEIMGLVAKNFSGRVLIMVPTDDLMRQTVKRLKEYFPKQIGMCGGGKKQMNFRIVVGLPRSLANHVKKDSFDLLLVDESHLCLTKTATKVVRSQSSARVFGFSGTPFRRSSDRKFLDWAKSCCLYGPILEKVSTDVLVERGISSAGKSFFIEAPSNIVGDQVVSLPENENMEMYKNAIMNNRTRNALIGNICVQANSYGLVVCVSFKLLDHLKRFYSMLLKIYSEQDIACIHGEMSGEERSLVVDQIKQGKFKLILVSKVFGVGVSINELDVLINAASGLSNFEAIQRFGRILRRNGDRPYTYIDFKDSGNKILLRHSNQRRKDIEAEINEDIPITKLSDYKSALGEYWDIHFGKKEI